jgi:hypothetical protein
LLELSDFPDELPEFSVLLDFSDAPPSEEFGLLELSPELLLGFSDELLLLEPSLPSALTGRGAPEGDL